MRIVPAPQFEELVSKLGKEIDLAFTPPVFEAADRVNRDYEHWVKARHLPRPPGVRAEHVWFAAKMRRSFRNLPATGTNNRPFVYTIPDSLLFELSQFDRLAGHPERFGKSSPEEFQTVRERIMLDTAMEEAISTSLIEGAVTTRAVAREMLRAGRPPNNDSERMIANGYRTMEMLSQHATRPLSVDLLNEWQRSMTEGTLDNPAHAGRFRTPDDAPANVVNELDGEVAHSPPPAELVSERMQKLIDFANDANDEAHFLHPLVRASVLHFWLAYEHPYNDGNGRTARTLFYWYLLRHDYGLIRYMTISRVIYRTRTQYYRAFRLTETDGNDVTYFILYMACVTHLAIKELRQRVAEMVQHNTAAVELFARTGVNARQRILLEHAVRKPNTIYTFASHAKSNKIGPITARHDLIDLFDRGLLIKTRDGKPIEFMAPGDLLERVTGNRMSPPKLLGA